MSTYTAQTLTIHQLVEIVFGDECHLCAQPNPCDCGNGPCLCNCGRCTFPGPLPDDGPDKQ